MTNDDDYLKVISGKQRECLGGSLKEIFHPLADILDQLDNNQSRKEILDCLSDRFCMNCGAKVETFGHRGCWCSPAYDD